MALTSSQIAAAAQHCADSYSDEKVAATKHVRKVDVFRMRGEVLGYISENPSGDTAYVAFRGTHKEQRGNWFLTNIQAFKAKFRHFDAKKGDRSTAHAGTVHQGFYRAFSWLWNGGDVAFANSTSIYAWAFARHALFGLLVYYYAGFGRYWPIFLWLFIFLFEFGIAEWFVRKKPAASGAPMRDHVPILKGYQSVIFTGHSLGGAMAAFAFASFAKSLEGKLGEPVIYLCTFGMPHLADRTFLDDFESRFSGRYTHFENPGDPVPRLPATIRQCLIWRLWSSLPWGPLICLSAILRAIYALLYHQTSPADWTSGVYPSESKGTLRIREHFMETYIAYLISSQTHPPASHSASSSLHTCGQE